FASSLDVCPSTSFRVPSDNSDDANLSSGNRASLIEPIPVLCLGPLSGHPVDSHWKISKNRLICQSFDLLSLFRRNLLVVCNVQTIAFNLFLVPCFLYVLHY